MPWRTQSLAEIRLSFALAVRTGGLSVAQASRQFGVSRRTAHKWLSRFDRLPASPLVDHLRRTHRSPNRTPDGVVQRIVGIHAEQHWGPRKIQNFITRQGEPAPTRALEMLVQTVSPASRHTRRGAPC